MSQCCHAHLRYLEIRHVILSAAKDLASLPPRSFAALRMTCRTPHEAAHGKSSLQMSTFASSFWTMKRVFLLTLADGECDKMENSVAKNFVEGKSNEHVREVGHHARKAAPSLPVVKAQRESCPLQCLEMTIFTMVPFELRARGKSAHLK